MFSGCSGKILAGEGGHGYISAGACLHFGWGTWTFWSGHPYISSGACLHFLPGTGTFFRSCLSPCVQTHVSLV